MCTVLVADDDPTICGLVCSILGFAGHHCLAAANGLEAVSLFRSNRGKIDLVITDIMMPVMDGPQAVIRIRETDPAVPVIFMSGYGGDIELPSKAHVLQKPFTPQALIGVVNQIIKIPSSSG